MLDCPPAAPGESAADDDDGFGDAPAMDADVSKVPHNLAYPITPLM